MITPLTPRKARVLSYIRAYQASHGYAPSSREIAAHLGRVQTCAMQVLTALEDKGYIRRTRGIPRSIVVLGDT